MTNYMSIILLSLFTALMPHLGFPRQWEMYIVTGSSLLIAGIALMLFREEYVIFSEEVEPEGSVLPEPFSEDVEISTLEQKDTNLIHQ